MEDEKLDDVTRPLDDGSSRRQVVGGLLGGVLGALGLGVAAGEDAGAARIKKVTVCQNGMTRRVSAKAWRRMRLSGAADKGKCLAAPIAPTPPAPGARTCPGGNAASCFQRNLDDDGTDSPNGEAVCCQPTGDDGGAVGTAICITAADRQVAIATCKELGEVIG